VQPTGQGDWNAADWEPSSISRFTFAAIDESYYERAKRFQQQGSFVVGGENYDQGRRSGFDQAQIANP
jgi:hypothetical protein